MQIQFWVILVLLANIIQAYNIVELKKDWSL